MKVHIGEYTKDDSERVVEVEVHGYDTCNLDHTLALIIAPALKKFLEVPHGAPHVDDWDVPDELKQKECVCGHHYDSLCSCDDTVFARWDHVLGEMIFAFENIRDDAAEDKFFRPTYDKEAHDAWNERIANGLRLFGKYYRALWN